MTFLSANWLEWYHFRHQQGCLLTGNAFEVHVTALLSAFHDDFYNPAPMGTLGDGGCDGLAETGTILYACYGSRAMQDAERKLKAKMEADFTRGLSSWSTFTKWRFVTNATPGIECGKYLTGIQETHGPNSSRPIEPRVWGPERLWTDIVSQLPPAKLNVLFPGAPGVEHVDLADLIPLLDVLGVDGSPHDAGEEIRPVSPKKMDFNELPAASRSEFNEGRLLAPRINRWYEENSVPDLRDLHGERFRQIYAQHRQVTTDSLELLERTYVSVGGSNFRMDGRRANAVYAVTSYFFDSCHIFEEPPSDSELSGSVAATD